MNGRTRPATRQPQQRAMWEAGRCPLLSRARDRLSSRACPSRRNSGEPRAQDARRTRRPARGRSRAGHDIPENRSSTRRLARRKGTPERGGGVSELGLVFLFETLVDDRGDRGLVLERTDGGAELVAHEHDGTFGEKLEMGCAPLLGGNEQRDGDVDVALVK